MENTSTVNNMRQNTQFCFSKTKNHKMLHKIIGCLKTTIDWIVQIAKFIRKWVCEKVSHFLKRNCQPIQGNSEPIDDPIPTSTDNPEPDTAQHTFKASFSQQTADLLPPPTPTSTDNTEPDMNTPANTTPLLYPSTEEQTYLINRKIPPVDQSSIPSSPSSPYSSIYPNETPFQGKTPYGGSDNDYERSPVALIETNSPHTNFNNEGSSIEDPTRTPPGSPRSLSPITLKESDDADSSSNTSSKSSPRKIFESFYLVSTN